MLEAAAATRTQTALWNRSMAFRLRNQSRTGWVDAEDIAPPDRCRKIVNIEHPFRRRDLQRRKDTYFIAEEFSNVTELMTSGPAYHCVEAKFLQSSVYAPRACFFFWRPFNVDPRIHSNGINRIVMLQAITPKPHCVLMISLSVGSWQYVIGGWCAPHLTGHPAGWLSTEADELPRRSEVQA